MASSISPPLQILLSDALRAHCEITPFPPKSKIDALQTTHDAKAYLLKREVAHNQTLGECNLRGDALVSAVDAANAQLNKLAGK